MSAQRSIAQLKLLLLLPSLHGGGAERVALNLLKGIDPNLAEVRIGLLKEGGHYFNDLDYAALVRSSVGQGLFDFDGPNSLAYHPLKALQAAVMAPRRIRSLIRSYEPDIIISFLKGMNLLTWRALNGMQERRPFWIAREGNNALRVIEEEAPNTIVKTIVKHLTAKVYRAADITLGISKRQAQDLCSQFNLDPSRVRFIHNGIDVDLIRSCMSETPNGLPTKPFIVTAGRLEPQKGHDLLLEAYAKSVAHAAMDLVLLGTGSQLDLLKSKAANLGISERVHFPGFQNNPWSWFARSEFFVFPSKWEGFGNVVAEALACGVPVLSTDCDYGPGEIVEHGVNGLLVKVGDNTALAQGLDTMATNKDWRRQLAARSVARARKFNVRNMCYQYERLLNETTSDKVAPRNDP